MEDLRVGALARAVRHRLGWRQADVAVRAGVSQRLVSKLETGQLDHMTVESVRRITAALEIRTPFAARWRGGDGIRLLDADHAALLDRTVAILRAADWESVIEYTFNHFGERGSVDVIGWQARERALLLVEVKSRLVDSQDTIATLGRKARVVPALIAQERGWAASRIGVALVVEDLTANRTVVSRHMATFGAAFPARGRAVRSWLRNPLESLWCLWFLSLSTGHATTRRSTSRRRVRRPRPRSVA